MSANTLQTARGLIQQKRYDEARALLQLIPYDPTAQQWLTKLNQVAPDPFANTASVPPTKPKNKAIGYLLGGLSLLCFFAGVFTLILLISSLSAPGRSTSGTLVAALVVAITFGLAVALRSAKTRLT